MPSRGRDAPCSALIAAGARGHEEAMAGTPAWGGGLPPPSVLVLESQACRCPGPPAAGPQGLPSLLS